MLIKNQLKKNIPQHLREFIRLARSMCIGILKGNRTDAKNKENIENKLKDFEKFLDRLNQAEEYFGFR